ncbi:MAG: hypothetical protein WC868_05195 [Bacteroidales bacterium]
MNNKRILFISFIFAALLAESGYAQTRISSPYSRYGIGDLQNNKYLRNISMGGISYAFRSPYGVNYTNPASYTVFDTMSFVFETGVYSNLVQLSSKALSQKSNYASLACLVFGFPVTKWWGSSIGLLPYSSVGYKISDEDTIDNIGKTKYLYEGSGGVNQFYIGNAFKMTKNFSVGFNAAYLFGYLDKTSTVSFPDSINFLALRLRNSKMVNDFQFIYGIQYQKSLKNGIKLGLGLVYNSPTHLSAKQDSLAYRFFPTGNGYESIKDTLINSNNTKGKVVLPQGLGGGITIGKTDSWLVGMDYQLQNWKNYSSFGEKDSLKNSWMVSFGTEFTPKNSAVSGYWKKVHYRAGARYNQTYLQLRNNQLAEYAVSFGFGLPLKRSKTVVNLGFELGQRGTTQDNLIKEKFGRFILSLSVYELWFIKRRFD